MYKKRDLNNFPTKENILKYEIIGNRIIFKEGIVVILYDGQCFFPQDSLQRIDCDEFLINNKRVIVPHQFTKGFERMNNMVSYIEFKNKTSLNKFIKKAGI